MNLSNEDKAKVKDFLWEEVKYQETFEEVYDHVLTALQKYTNVSSPLITKVKAVLNEDFGGFDTLREFEKQRRCLAGGLIMQSYYKQMLKLVNLRNIALTMLAITIFYNWPKSFPAAFLIVSSVILALAPVMMVGYKGIVRLFKFSDKKPSIYDAAVFRISFASYFIYIIIENASRYIFKTNNFKVLAQTHSWLVVLMVIVYFTLGLSFIKMYRNQYRTKIVR